MQLRLLRHQKMMQPMKTLSEIEKKALWEEVKQEFPDDDTMQQVHYVQLLHYYQTLGMTSAQKIAFYQRQEKKSA